RLRHDTDDGEGESVERNGLAEDLPVALKLVAPDVVHKHDDVVVAGMRFFSGKGTAKLGGGTQYGEDTRCGAEHLDLQRVAAVAQRHRVFPHDSHRLEAAVVLLPHREVVCVHGQGGIDVTELRDLFLYDGQPLRV